MNSFTETAIDLGSSADAVADAESAHAGADADTESTGDSGTGGSDGELCEMIDVTQKQRAATKENCKGKSKSHRQEKESGDHILGLQTGNGGCRCCCLKC